jgi:hypothetical protein
MTARTRQLASSDRCSPWLPTLLLLMAASGCNALLGNESVAGSQGDGITATSTITDEPSSNGDAGARISSGSSGAAADGGKGAAGAGAMSKPAGSGGGDAAGSASTPITCASLQCPEHSHCDDSAPACVCVGGYELRSGVCIDADECADHSAACDANAACLNQDGGYACECMAPYVGDGMRCTLDTSCQAQHCDADARCEGGGCVCITGFEGDGHTCTRSDPCQSTPCANGGACSATASGFSCDCAGTGFTGTTCREPVDDCASKPCKNGGTCSDGVNDYTCACAGAWTGKNCDQSTGCDYDGTHYSSGVTFPAGDGCNTCSCSSSGAAVCTTRVCTGQSCGGLAGAKCPSGQYCSFDSGCGASDRQGTCQAPPTICNDAVVPVCGCDGKTYPNACYAARAQQSVQKTGACTPAPAGCTYGGMSFDPGTAMIPAADGCNTCTCTSSGEVVCTNKVCTSGCGGKQGAGCAGGQYCSYPVGMCGANPASGKCTAKPGACPDVVKEVCGCDGKTYSNSCRAGSAGVSLQSNDACGSP